MSERAAVIRRHLPGMAPSASAGSSQPRGGAKPYRRGSRAEYELLTSFRADSRLCVRSASSHGPFDLIVLDDDGGRAIQVKVTTQVPTDGQLARWLDALPAVPRGWQALLMVKTPRGWTTYGASDG